MKAALGEFAESAEPKPPGACGTARWKWTESESRSTRSIIPLMADLSTFFIPSQNPENDGALNNAVIPFQMFSMSVFTPC